MTYYIVYVFLMAGLTGNANLTSGGIQYALFIVFTCVTYLFIDSKYRSHLRHCWPSLTKSQKPAVDRSSSGAPSVWPSATSSWAVCFRRTVSRSRAASRATPTFSSK